MRQLAQLVKICPSLCLRQLAQFCSMLARDEETITAIILPFSEQHHGVGELPNDLINGKLIECGEFVAEEAFAIIHVAVLDRSWLRYPAATFPLRWAKPHAR